MQHFYWKSVYLYEYEFVVWGEEVMGSWGEENGGER